MDSRRLLFVLLGFFLEALNVSGQREADCPALQLEGGFVVPPDGIGWEETCPHKTTVSYSCDQDRKPSVEGWWATSECQNGIWTPTPQCVGVNDCLDPEIPNAQYTPPYVNAKKIRIKCDEGYTLSGSATMTCTDGNWTSSPICERDINACPQPDEIPNAVIMHEYQTMFPDGTNLLYQCETGYSVAQGENKSIECVYGKWDEIEPCVIRCDPPGDEEHAEWQLVESGSEVEYTCQTGYQLVRGSSKRRCTLNGWDGAAPVCQIRCDRPDDAEHAEWQLLESGFGSEVVYTCKTGYQLVRGSSKRRCKSNGWDGEAPVCQIPESCGHPGDAEHAELKLVEGEDFVFGSEVQYTCRPGYQLVRGSSKRRCTLNGWDGEAPVCQKDAVTPAPPVPSQPAWTRPAIVPIGSCGTFPTIQDGVVKPERMSLKVECVNYYKLVGLERVVCYANGAWSTSPTCRAAFCRLDTAPYRPTNPDDQFLREGASGWVHCAQEDFYGPFWALVKCGINGLQAETQCCSQYYRHCPRI